MAATKFQIQPLDSHHWESVLAVYLQGLATSLASFETSAPSWEKWDTTHLPVARLAAISEYDLVMGWAALSPVSSRPVYEGVAEVSVYVENEFKGIGVGRALLQQLVVGSERNGIWTLQASVFPENYASLALHKSCGFRQVGRRERIGKLGGLWRDTILLERRSETVGTD